MAYDKETALAHIAWIEKTAILHFSEYGVSMHTGLITPASGGSTGGNQATAERWRAALERLGHQVTVANRYHNESFDLLLALHAYRSAEAISGFRERFPRRPLIVALTGTDIYRFQTSDPRPTLASMNAATTLIGLHDRVAEAIPDHLHSRLHTVFQSANLTLQADDAGDRKQRELEEKQDQRHFDICVIGHLREEKDPFRTARAVRSIQDDVSIRVFHAGRAHSEEWAKSARQEMGVNPRYTWLGEVDQDRVHALMRSCDLMVISSIMEGGANVVSEACVAGLPIIASEIPGNTGLLGESYPGYYPVRDTAALKQCLLRAAQDTAFRESLQSACTKRGRLFTPENEQADLQRAMDHALSVTGTNSSP
jgi:putative glycosyltransferase (TIGR04348 family)